MATQTHPDAPRPGYEPGPGILAQVSRELLWPRLLRSVSLAIRPERLFVAGLMFVLIALVLRAPAWWLGPEWLAPINALFPSDWSRHAGWWPELSVGAAVAPILAIPDLVAVLWGLSWWSTLIVLPIVLLIWGVGGCIISRIVACDVAQGILVPWPEAGRFAMDRAGSILFALVAPVLLGIAIWLGLALAGLLLFSVAWVNVLGGALYVFFIIAAVVAVVVLAAYAVGFPLIVPAVACEGADGIDALARAYPYVFGRPLRYLLYVVIIILLGQLAFAVADAVAYHSYWFARDAATAWTGSSAERIMAAANPDRIPAVDGLTSSENAAARLIRFWEGLLVVILAAFVVSYFFSASTVLYLLMRRVCDGQDIGEIWMPGMIEGTMTMTMEARARAAAGAGVATGGLAAADDT